MKGCSADITDRSDLWSTRFRWYDIHTKFYKDRTNIQVILRLLLQQFERLQCWYYWWEGLTKYTTQMAADGMICIPNLIINGSGIKVILRLLSQQFKRLHCWYYWWERFTKYVLRWLHVAWYIYQVSWTLVLLMSGIYELCHWDGLSWHDMHNKFHDDLSIMAFK
jgi:hypothetical protein